MKIKCPKKPSKLMRRIDSARANFNINEKIIKIIFIDQFHHLVSNYQKLESEVASKLSSLQEKDLTISTQLSTISTQATTILDNELAKQILEFTISSHEHSISELRLTELQLQQNARFNLAQFLPDAQHRDPLHHGCAVHLPCKDSLQLGTLPYSTHLGGLKVSLSASSSNTILTPCVLPGLVLDEDAQGDLLHMGEADDMLHEGDVLLLVSTGGSRSGVSLPHSTPTSSTPSSPPVTHQQILPTTEKVEMEPFKFTQMRDIDKASISNLVKVVDDLSTKYSNPNLFNKTIPGYRTTMGVVPVPNYPVGGYIYCLETDSWLLHATSGPSTRKRWGTAKRGRPGGTGGRGRR